MKERDKLKFFIYLTKRENSWYSNCVFGADSYFIAEYVSL